MLADGVIEGRRIFANTIKYVLMATSSNFGNMFSAAGASLFLSFLPMLPSQILLNNLLYDVGQMAIPTDSVDAEIARPPGRLGHRVRPPLHDRVRARSARSSTSSPSSSCSCVLQRQPRRVPHRLVRRVARHPDARHLRDPHPPRPVLPQPPEPRDDRSLPIACAVDRRDPALHAARRTCSASRRCRSRSS